MTDPEPVPEQSEPAPVKRSAAASLYLSARMLVLAGGIGAIVYVVLTRAPLPSDSGAGTAIGSLKASTGTLPPLPEQLRPNLPFAEPLSIGARAVPTGGDALLQDGQQLLAEPRPSMEVGTAPPASICFSPDGTLLVANDGAHTIALRDARTGAKQGELSLGAREYLAQPTFAPDGQLLAVRSSAKTHLWEVRTGKLQQSLVTEGTCHAFTRAGKSLVLIDRKGSVAIVSARTGAVEQILSERIEHFAHHVAFSADARLLAIPQREGKRATVLELPGGAVRQRFDLDRGTIHALALSPDGTTLAVSSRNGAAQLVLYDLTTGQARHKLAVEGGWLTALAFSPTGRTLAGGRDNGGGVDLYDARTGTRAMHLTGVSMTVLQLAFAPDGQSLAAVDNYESKIYSWDLRPSEQRHTLTSAAGINTVTASPSGKLLALATEKGIDICDADSAAKRHTLGAGQYWGQAQFTADEQAVVARGAVLGEHVRFELATGRTLPLEEQHDASSVAAANGRSAYARNRQLAIFDGAKLVQRIDEPEALQGVSVVALSGDGKLVAHATARGAVKVWEAATGKRLFVLDAHEGTIRAIAFSADGSWLATGGTHAVDHSVRLWDMRTGQETAALAGHRAAVTGLLFAPDGRHLVSCGDDGQLLVWDLARRALLRSLRGHRRQVAGLTAAGALFTSLDRDSKAVFFWEWRAVTQGDPQSAAPLPRPPSLPGLLIRQQDLGPPPGVFFSSSFSPDGRWLTWTVDKDVHVRELRDGKTAWVLKGHTGYPGPSVFAPDGRYLVTAGSDRTIRWWDLTTGKEDKCWPVRQPAMRQLAFTPDGKALITASYYLFEDEVQVWDVASGAVRFRVPKMPHFSSPECVAVSADGRRIAIGGHGILLYDAQSLALLHLLKTPVRCVTLAFSPDGQLLAAGGEKTSSEAPVSVFATATGKLLHTIKCYHQTVYSVAFVQHGKTLLTVGSLRSTEPPVRLWDMRTGAETLRLAHLGRLQLLRDGVRLASVDLNSMQVWDVGAGLEPALHEALAALRGLDARLEQRDGLLWITHRVMGRHSSAALAQLAKIPRLLGVQLEGAGNDDLALLANARNMKALYLHGSNELGSAALPHLQMLSWLELLQLPPGFTAGEIAALQQALPRTRIVVSD